MHVPRVRDCLRVVANEDDDTDAKEDVEPPPRDMRKQHWPPLLPDDSNCVEKPTFWNKVQPGVQLLQRFINVNLVIIRASSMTSI